MNVGSEANLSTRVKLKDMFYISFVYTRTRTGRHLH